jgi:hypothetical protein
VAFAVVAFAVVAFAVVAFAGPLAFAVFGVFAVVAFPAVAFPAVAFPAVAFPAVAFPAVAFPVVAFSGVAFSGPLAVAVFAVVGLADAGFAARFAVDGFAVGGFAVGGLVADGLTAALRAGATGPALAVLFAGTFAGPPGAGLCVAGTVPARFAGEADARVVRVPGPATPVIAFRAEAAAEPALRAVLVRAAIASPQMQKRARDADDAHSRGWQEYGTCASTTTCRTI